MLTHVHGCTCSSAIRSPTPSQTKRGFPGNEETTKLRAYITLKVSFYLRNTVMLAIATLIIIGLSDLPPDLWIHQVAAYQ